MTDIEIFMITSSKHLGEEKWGGIDVSKQDTIYGYISNITDMVGSR